MKVAKKVADIKNQQGRKDDSAMAGGEAIPKTATDNISLTPSKSPRAKVNKGLNFITI